MLGSFGITQALGAEVSKLSHARTLRYKTCLYALVEDFMVAGGMWRKMIASRHQREKKWEGRRKGSKSGEWQESCEGGANVSLAGPLGILHLHFILSKQAWEAFHELLWKYSVSKSPISTETSCNSDIYPLPTLFACACTTNLAASAATFITFHFDRFTFTWSVCGLTKSFHRRTVL